MGESEEACRRRVKEGREEAAEFCGRGSGLDASDVARREGET
jgi:hypothetical protein